MESPRVSLDETHLVGDTGPEMTFSVTKQDLKGRDPHTSKPLTYSFPCLYIVLGQVPSTIVIRETKVTSYSI